jgi:hypothetical protein
MSQTTGSATCASCGAPDDGEFVNCRYCKQAVNADALARAIPCPNPACRMACRWGKQKCGACQSWLVVSCVFCGAISPHNCSNCLRCNEAFAGAPQRKAQMQAQQQQQQNMQAVSTWGGVAAAFAGAAVGASLGSHHHSGGYYYHEDHYASNYSPDYDYSPPSSSDDYDTSNVVDDAGGFFSSDDD